MLVTACAQQGVPHAGMHVQRLGLQAGHCSDDPPWDTKKVKARVEEFRTTFYRLRKARDTLSDDAYGAEVVAFLGRLRNTWERAIEEYLFNEVIQRFGYGVKTLSLKTVDVAATDYAIIEAGMGVCSAWVHDPSQGLSSPPPTPQQLAEMVNDLVHWTQSVCARRKGANMTAIRPIETGMGA